MSAVCHEPGFHTIFEEASPTFKIRFMYMSGISDEAEFDELCRTMTWEGHAEKIRAPYLCLAGEHAAADWMAATLAGQPFPSERWYVEASGNVVRRPL